MSVSNNFPYENSKGHHVYDDYRTLPFPFESVGLGSEGNSLLPDIQRKFHLREYLGFLRSWSAWRVAKLLRTVVYMAFMRLESKALMSL